MVWLCVKIFQAFAYIFVYMAMFGIAALYFSAVIAWYALVYLIKGIIWFSIWLTAYIAERRRKRQLTNA